MKHFAYATVSLILVAFSCSKIEPGDVVSPLETSSIEEALIASSSDNHVSLNDILEVISRDYPATKNADYSYELSSYVGDDSDTLMYILNLGNGDGWKIYSSDKRTPAILAEGEKGYFSLEEGSPAVAAWVSCMAADMARVKGSTDDELTFNDDEISSNKAFWPGLQMQSRLFDPSQPIITPYPKGHWEETVTTSIVEYDHVNHMVAKWDQYNPYNACCPYVAPNERAVTGCVAVAGAQMLYYLHNKLGVPSGMFTQCSYVGNNLTYTYSFANLSTTVWDLMNINYTPPSTQTIPEAVLMSYVGDRVNMHYWNEYSWAVPENLKTNLFESNGISCFHGNYDDEIVKNSLLNNMPVIVSASDLLLPLDGDIHCFVIDGYRRTQTKYTHHHYYVLDEAPGGMYVMPDDYETYTYSSPELTSIKINWGWWTQWNDDNPLNDGWYSLTGEWIVTNGDELDYNHNRKMIYGFAVAE